MIRLLKRTEINELLWNHCVKNAVNSSVSGYTWYLDEVCKNWCGLVLNNYEAVFALPVKSKFKITYLLQPPFTKTLNIYSKQTITKQLVFDFLNSIPSSIKLVDINLQYNDVIELPDFKFTNKVYQTLRLHKPYIAIKQGYSAAVERNLKKAEKNNLRVIKNISVKQLVTMYKNNVGYKLKHLKSKDYKILEQLMNKAIEYKAGFKAGVVDGNNQLVAAAFFMTSEHTLSFFNGSSTLIGKSSGAMYLLFDEIFKEFADQHLIFDFEGSTIKSIADFNTKFGAKDCIYLQVKKNSLPYLVKKMSGRN